LVGNYIVFKLKLQRKDIFHQVRG